MKQMDKAKLKKYKEKLIQAREDLLKDLELEQEYLSESNEQGDLVDLADNLINNEILNKLSDIDIEKIKLIDRALEKIENGTFGVCEGTGKAIPEARLNTIPWTPYTVEYAEQLERQQKNS